MSTYNCNIFQMKSKPHGIERINEFVGIDGGGDSFVAIGWPGIGDLTNVDKEEIRKRLEKQYNYKGPQLGTYLSAVNTFVNTMKKEDLVLISNKLGQVFIFEVGEYHYEKDYDSNDFGFCHQRKAKLLKVLNKAELNPELQGLLRNRGTITQFKYPYDKSGLDKWFEPLEEDVDLKKLVKSALDILERELLAEDPIIRIKSAAEILRYAKENK
ncbi:hypothetical protein M3936_19465 [Sutcliffiella horikoshii]|uniref:hypothetical protein n=1 Tax=Sutcliffiella horikoshii TaxID=79883 RepID=UPI00203B1D23|nr:hypothetical protein [Sutcliffiella horikoshii]MCM3619753.1 hypothetical protein [Sutcliffiella horikoshii]